MHWNRKRFTASEIYGGDWEMGNRTEREDPQKKEKKKETRDEPPQQEVEE